MYAPPQANEGQSNLKPKRKYVRRKPPEPAVSATETDGSSTEVPLPMDDKGASESSDFQHTDFDQLADALTTSPQLETVAKE